jgi:hypothetical protein
VGWRETLGSRPRYLFLLIVLLALALRLAFALTLPERILWPDGERYQQVAVNLLEGRGFGSLRENEQSVPTLPLYMAATYMVAGRRIPMVRLSSALLGALTCGLAFVIGRRLFGTGAGVIAALILVFYPYYIYISALFEYPTNLYILLVALAFLFLPDFGAGGRVRAALGAGFFLGLAALAIPTVLAFIPLAAAAGWLLGGSLRRQLVPSLVLIAGAALPLGAWAGRNYAAYDAFILINSAGDRAFWMGNNPFMLKYREPDGGAWIEDFASDTYSREEVARDWEAMPIVRVEKGNQSLHATAPLYRRAALQFIGENPGGFIRLTLYKFLELWRPVPQTLHKNVHTTGRTTLIGAVTYVPVLLLAIAGVAFSLGRWRRCFLIYLYIAVLAGSYSLLIASVRYRLPIDFFLALFAGLAVVEGWRRIRRPSSRSAPGPPLHP